MRKFGRIIQTPGSYKYLNPIRSVRQYKSRVIKESDYKYNNYLHQDSFVNATFWSGSPLRKKTEPRPAKVEGFSGLERLRRTVGPFPTEVGGFKPDF